MKTTQFFCYLSKQITTAVSGNEKQEIFLALQEFS